MLDLKRNRIAIQGEEAQQSLLICVASRNRSLAESCSDCLQMLDGGGSFGKQYWSSVFPERNSSAEVIFSNKSSVSSLPHQIWNDAVNQSGPVSTRWRPEIRSNIREGQMWARAKTPATSLSVLLQAVYSGQQPHLARVIL
jgi:hypothetical protein